MCIHMYVYMHVCRYPLFVSYENYENVTAANNALRISLLICRIPSDDWYRDADEPNRSSVYFKLSAEIWNNQAKQILYFVFLLFYKQPMLFSTIRLMQDMSTTTITSANIHKATAAWEFFMTNIIAAAVVAGNGWQHSQRHLNNDANERPLCELYMAHTRESPRLSSLTSSLSWLVLLIPFGICKNTL